MVERHPYPPFLPDDCRCLVVGSFPPARLTQARLGSRDIPFYYGSSVNGFWKMLGELYGAECTSLEQVKGLLTRLHMGITDMAEACRRREGSSRDEDLDIVEYRDLTQLLLGIPSLGTVYVTSLFVERLFLHQLAPHCRTEKRDGFSRGVVLPEHGRSFLLVRLYSPSRRNRLARATVLAQYRAYLPCLE